MMKTNNCRTFVFFQRQAGASATGSIPDSPITYAWGATTKEKLPCAVAFTI